MIPKIVFRYSNIHDSFWKNYLEIFYKLKKDPRTKKILDEYPSNKKIINFINKIRPLWEKDEKRILKEISKITG
ncbi:hypothetical protein CXT76_02385, partial [Candidatus Parvarchaeota archaeon]